MNKNYKIFLEWYEKDPGNKILGEEEIHLTDEELAKLMRFKAEYPPFRGGMYPIKKYYRKLVQSLVSHTIELDKHEYFIVSRALDTSEYPYERYKNTDAWKIMKIVFKDLRKHEDIKCILHEDGIIGYILDFFDANNLPLNIDRGNKNNPTKKD